MFAGLYTMGTDRAGWAIDDVFIGGDETNPSMLKSSFEKADKENIGNYHFKVLLSIYSAVLNLILYFQI